MNWIAIGPNNSLPERAVEVLVRVFHLKYKRFAYKLSYLGLTQEWFLGTATNYIVTHWMKIEEPK